MSIYSEAQELISYMTLIKNLDSDASYYPPRTILQSVYGSGLYKVLEYISVQHDAQQDLTQFTVKMLKVLRPYIYQGLGEQFNITFIDTQYDPTLQIYKEDELLGFIDLPSFTFYYQEPREISKAKERIAKNLASVKKLEAKKRRIISDYDYKTKEGVEKAIAYMVRKNNTKQANIEIADVDRKIRQLQMKAIDQQSNLSKAEEKNAQKIRDIQKISSFLSKDVGIDSIPIEETKQEGSDD